MTEPSQYFKGRTVQEQMDEVIGYVDKRAEEVAAAKADDVLQPAEDAKTAAQAAQVAAEDAQAGAEAAKDATLAALPAIQQDISGLKAEDAALDGRLDTVELKVTTAEGNIATIQGQIVALQTADGQNVKINNINQYAVGLTGNQTKNGILKLQQSSTTPSLQCSRYGVDVTSTITQPQNIQYQSFTDANDIALADILIQRKVDGGTTFYIRVRNSDGTYKILNLGTGD